MKFDRIYVEISNVCNLQCDFCPEVEREKQVMSRDFFRHVVKECRPFTDEITMHVMGEPMNHPEFGKMVEVAGEEGLAVQITTNGTLLRDPKRREALFAPHIRQVNFSLQSVTAQKSAGESISSDALRERYLQTIFAFVREAFERRPDLYINFRLWNLGTDAASQEGNRLFLEPIEREFGVAVALPIISPGTVGFRKSRRLLRRLYVHFDSRFEWPSLQTPVRQTEGSCHALKSHIAILADGTVVPCCLDKESRLVLGQIAATETGGLARALASPRAQKIRSEFDKGRVCEDLCQRCQFIERFSSVRSGVRLSPTSLVAPPLQMTSTSRS